MLRKAAIVKMHGQVFTGLFENNQLSELHCSVDNAKTALGNVYVARVNNIVPNIDAAFVEVQKGVICYFPICEVKYAIFTKKSSHKKALCIGDELLVQISREAVKTKAPTVSSKLEFSGRYVVLSHGVTKIGVSSKIDKERRKELLELMEPFRNETYGLILRTNAKDAEDEAILAETKKLICDYKSLSEIGKSRVVFSCLRQAEPDYLTDLKNIYADQLESIIVDGEELCSQIQSYLEQNRPELLDVLQLYTDPRLPLAKLYNMESELESALSAKVWLKHGGYLVIQPTEALTVIDVNTGKSIGKKSSADHYYNVNLEAAKEAARQIRIRNLSGIILIDFINLEGDSRVDDLLTFFRKELNKDPIPTTLVDITKLYLVEVTRKKVRRPLYETIRSIGMEERRSKSE